MDQIACAEINCILNQLDKESLKKIPYELVSYFSNNRDKNYISNIDLNIPLANQKLRLETINILCAINYMYLCDDKEKEELDRIYEENEKRFIESTDIYKILEKRANKNKEKLIEQSENNYVKDMVVYKKHSFIRTILNKLKSIFNLKWYNDI